MDDWRATKYETAVLIPAGAYVCLQGEWKRTHWLKRGFGWPGYYRLNKWCLGHVVVYTETQWRF